MASNGKEIVDIQLVREATTGHLSVKEKSRAGRSPCSVLVDGADVGAAPIDIEVAPGPAAGSSSGARRIASPAQQSDGRTRRGR